jgi:predicted nucleic acid-binding Zn ribbon protein
MDILSVLTALGLGGGWLPILVSLVVVPTLYVILALSAHKEYGEVIRKAVDRDEVVTPEEKRILLDDVSERLRIFDLDWWIIAAFGILIAAIIGSGYLSEWAPIAPIHAQTGIATYRCGVSGGHVLCADLLPDPASRVRATMSLYATLVGLVIAFRLGWARVKLAQDFKHYYVYHLSALRENPLRRSAMPPSGYTTKQAQCVADFLRSCAEALEHEAKQRRVPLTSAIDGELRSISNHLKNASVTPNQKSVLHLTEVFYRSLREKAPSDSTAFANAVHAALDDVRGDILAIKVAVDAQS